MNLKVANLVALQFGVLLGIASWLAYSHFESAEPRVAAAEMRKGPVNSIASSAPVSEPGSQVSRALDSGDDLEQDRSSVEQPALATLPPQYSPEAVQQYTAMAAQQYYQQIAPRRYASTGFENQIIAASAPAYTEVARQPAAVSSDYVEPVQTAAYAEPAPVFVYQQPVQFIVFSEQRRFPNRCRPRLQPGAITPIAHPGPERIRPHRNGCGVTPRNNPDVPSCRPNQGPRPRGKR